MTGNSPDTPGPLPSQPRNAATMSIKLRSCVETFVAAEQSVLALVHVLTDAGLSESLEGITSLSDRYGLGLADERDIFRVELSLGSAGGAADHDIFRMLPSQGYLELVAAVAVDCGVETVVSHGWPILSVVASTATVTDGAAPASAAPEATSSSVRERAFDAAQRLVLSQPSMVIGQMEQRRQADFILDLAERFESWMTRPAAAPDSAERVDGRFDRQS